MIPLRLEPPQSRFPMEQAAFLNRWRSAFLTWAQGIGATSGQGDQILNNSALTFPAGTLIGFSGGVMCLADDTAEGLGPVFVNLEDAPPGGLFTPRSWGLVDVRATTTSGWSKGTTGWVDGGMVTPTAPSTTGQYRFQVGVAQDSVVTGGKIKMFLLPALWRPELVP